MILTYRSILFKIRNFLGTVDRLTDIGNHSGPVMENLTKPVFQKACLHEIKTGAEKILREIAFLHCFTPDPEIASNIEQLGSCIKDLVNTWDVFFTCLLLMGYRTLNMLFVSQVKSYHEGSSFDVKKILQRMSDVQEKLRGVFFTCDLRSRKEAKEAFYENFPKFQLSCLRFDKFYESKTAGDKSMRYGTANRANLKRKYDEITPTHTAVPLLPLRNGDSLVLHKAPNEKITIEIKRSSLPKPEEKQLKRPRLSLRKEIGGSWIRGNRSEVTKRKRKPEIAEKTETPPCLEKGEFFVEEEQCQRDRKARRLS